MENLTQRWTLSAPFFQKSGQFFWFSKRAGEASPLPLAARLWVWLNMHQYPWICLNILINAYEWTVLTMLGPWICMIILHVRHTFEDASGCTQSSEYDAELWICLIMAPYPSIMPEYALISLSMLEHGWILLNVPENAWINCSDCARVLNTPRHSYNSINIIVTNVTILEFLSEQFVHQGALLPFYLFLTRVRT